MAIGSLLANESDDRADVVAGLLCGASRRIRKYRHAPILDPLSTATTDHSFNGRHAPQMTEYRLIHPHGATTPHDSNCPGPRPIHAGVSCSDRSAETRSVADTPGAHELRGDEPPRGRERVPDGAGGEITARPCHVFRYDGRGPDDAARDVVESGGGASRRQAGRTASRLPPRQHPRRRSRRQGSGSSPDAPPHGWRSPAAPRSHGDRDRADLQHRRQRSCRRHEPDGAIRSGRRRRPPREREGAGSQSRLHEARVRRSARARRRLHGLGSAPHGRLAYDQRLISRLPPHPFDPAQPLAQSDHPELSPRDDDAGDHEVARSEAQGARLLLRQLRPRQRGAGRAAPLEYLRSPAARRPELRRLPQPAHDPFRGVLVSLVQAPHRGH